MEGEKKDGKGMLERGEEGLIREMEEGMGRGRGGGEDGRRGRGGVGGGTVQEEGRLDRW